MKRITQQLYSEGTTHKHLNNALSRFHQQEPFRNGVDWEFQYLWAELTDEQCMMFLLQNPEYIGRFKDVTTPTNSST